MIVKINRAKQKFTPILVAIAEFANGSKFMIKQIKASGACRIIDMRTDKASYSSSIPAAWRNVRYQAQILAKTQNTTGWRG
jgi:hypothetical protein